MTKELQEIYNKCEAVCKYEVPIGIGKIILSTNDFNNALYKMPELNFIVTKNEKEAHLYCAENLEFGVVASGDTITEAIKWLTDMTIDVIQKDIEVSGFSALKDIVADNAEAYKDDWQLFYKLKFQLAEKDSDTNFTKTTYNKITQKYGVLVSCECNSFQEVA